MIRLLWTREADAADAQAAARVLADRSLQGAQLRRALRRNGVHTVDVDPFDLSRIHEAFSEGELRREADADGRRREAWQWLLDRASSPRELADLLASERLWEGHRPGSADASALASVLVSLGERLDRAAAQASPRQRSALSERLSGLGRSLPSEDLAQVLLQAERAGALHGVGVRELTADLQGERWVETLAGVVALEGRATQRLADVYRRFAPRQGDERLLPLVRARLAAPDRGRFAARVWKALETFLLDLEEDPFMDRGHAGALDALAADRRPDDGTAHGEGGLAEDPETHLDAVHVQLAQAAPVWRSRLPDRLEARGESLSAVEWVALLGRVGEEVPEVLSDRPALVEKAFLAACGRVRELDEAAREALLAFAGEWEGLLLPVLLRALAEEERIAVRRFLVEAVSRFSPAATPAIVARLRSAPWYVTRNLTLALGRRRDPRTVPVLRSLLAHDHPKVRREAIGALGRVGCPEGRRALEAFVSAPGAARAERELARRLLGARGGAEERP
ncbi:MAG: hypothetical protein Kow0092_08870 [Deferrisomatales bacterium]